MLASGGDRVLHPEDMNSKAMGVLVAVAVGATVAIGSSAVAVAMMPGEAAGEVQAVSAIAAPDQTASEGAASHAVLGGPDPVVALPPVPVALDGGAQAKEEPAATPAPKTTTPPVGAGNSNAGGNSGNSNSGSGNSAKDEEKAQKEADKAAEKAAKEAAKEAERQAKEAEKAAKEAQKDAEKADEVKKDKQESGEQAQ
jgi:hypothetical protein